MTNEEYYSLSKMEQLREDYKDVKTYSGLSLYDNNPKGCPSNHEMYQWFEYLENFDVEELYKRYPALFDMVRQILKEIVVLDTGEYDDYGTNYRVRFRDQFDEYTKKYPEIEESELLKKIFIYEEVYGTHGYGPYDFENHKWVEEEE